MARNDLRSSQTDLPNVAPWLFSRKFHGLLSEPGAAGGNLCLSPKSYEIFRLGVVLLYHLLAVKSTGQIIPGLPEPGLVFYGRIAVPEGTLGSGHGIVVWRVGNLTTTLTNTAATYRINGQAFYVLRLSFETRSIPGMARAFPSPNTLELTTKSTMHTRSATVDGTSVTLSAPSVFRFGAADRGLMERVDLQIDVPTGPRTRDDWAFLYFGTTNIMWSADPLGKGMTYEQQYVAGTDPLDPKSIFELIDIKPAQPTGIVIEWSSVAGKGYSVMRSSVLATNYISLGSPITATSARTRFTDLTATGPGPYFYRLTVE